MVQYFYQSQCMESVFILMQDVWHCEICNKKPGRGFGESLAVYVLLVIRLSYLVVPCIP